MNPNVLVLLLFAFFLACNSPSPRRPIVKSSTPVLEKSVTLNKKIVALEQAYIKRFVAKDYFTRLHQFKQRLLVLLPPQKQLQTHPYKGNQVFYEQEIQSLDGTVLVSKEALGIQSYVVDKEHRMKGPSRRNQNHAFGRRSAICFFFFCGVPFKREFGIQHRPQPAHRL